MRLLFLSATVGLYMIITSHAVPEPDTSTKASSENEEQQIRQLVANLSQKFLLKYLQQMSSTNESLSSESISALSALILMSILSNGARGEVHLKETGLPENNIEMVKIDDEKFMPELAIKYKLRISTKIFFPPNITVNSIFVNSGIVSSAPDTCTEALSRDAEKQSLLLIKDRVQRFTAKYMDKSFDESFMADRAFSPFSAFFLLSLLSYRANGRTRDKYLNIIQLSARESEIAKTGYRKFLEETAKNNLSIKTKIFVRSNSTLEPDFVILSKDVFKAEIGLYDRIWDDSDKVRVQINDWVQAQLNLPPLFPSLIMETETDMIVVNTIKLERAWKTPFNTSLTQPRPFYPLNSINIKKDPVNVPTMHISGRFRHGRLPELHTYFIELPFESKGDDDKMSMFILRPDNPEVIHLFSKRIAHLILTRLLNSTEEQVDLSLPQFSFVKQNEAWLPETKGNKEDLFWYRISRNTLAHEVVSVVVNETGHFADESTGVVDDLTLPRRIRRRRSNSDAPVKFLVDRPFIAIIVTFMEEFLNPLLVIKFPGSEFVPKNESRQAYILRPK